MVGEDFRPFVDQRENINIVYLFAEKVMKEELRRMVQRIVNDVQGKGILVSEATVNRIEPTAIMLKLNREGVSFQELNDLQSAAVDKDGYMGMRATIQDDIGKVFKPGV